MENWPRQFSIFFEYIILSAWPDEQDAFRLSLRSSDLCTREERGSFAAQNPPFCRTCFYGPAEGMIFAADGMIGRIKMRVEFHVSSN